MSPQTLPLVAPVNRPLQSEAGQRSLGPDAVRALGAMLVVYLHGCVPYLVNPMPGLVWPVMDQQSMFCDVTFWAVEVFVMPLFLVISGIYSYRAALGVQSLAFLKWRAKRLLRPLLFGMLIILPIDLYIWVLGMVAEGVVPASKLRSLKIPSPFGDHLWGLSHLWFLLYVYLYSAVLVTGVRMLRGGVPMRWRPATRRSCGIAAVVGGLMTLVFAPEVVFGFQHQFLPVISKWIYSGTFFAGGVALAIFDPQFRTLDRLAPRYFLVGFCALAASVTLGRWTLQEDSVKTQADALTMQAANPEWLIAVCLATITVIAAWGMTLGLLGLANRAATVIGQKRRLTQAIRYLAGASFWIYLVHHPILGLVHIDLKFFAPFLVPEVKAWLSTAIAIVLGLASYETMIKSSRFGRWVGLTGGTNPATTKADETEQPEKNPIIRIAA